MYYGIELYRLRTVFFIFIR